LPHSLPLQTRGLAQLLLTVQAVKHVEPLQT
jgi:hypothetical protein